MNSRLLLRAAVLALPFAVFACTGGSGDDTTQEGGQDLKHVQGNAEGLPCGGIAGFTCKTGLICQMTGPSHPDQDGVCSKPPPPATCQAIPACDPGTQAVPTCDVKDKTCSSKTMCGHTIFCAKPQFQCQAIPACPGTEVEVDSCEDGDADCSLLSLCGHSIFCAKPKVQCQAIPACGAGKVAVDACDADDSNCAPVTMCGHTIHCTKASK